MKVIVGYIGYKEEEIYLDDKFTPATTQDCGADELWENFYEEVCRKLDKLTDYDEICSIKNPDNGYYIEI